VAMVNNTLILITMCCKDIIYVLQKNLTEYEKSNARFEVVIAV
jgi:hypothetical protein